MKRAALILAVIACLRRRWRCPCGRGIRSARRCRRSRGHERDCAICHSLDYIPMNAPVMDRTAWEKTLQKMITRFGAPIDEASARDILDYLSAQYSRGASAR